jgi:hypothetical protein
MALSKKKSDSKETSKGGKNIKINEKKVEIEEIIKKEEKSSELIKEIKKAEEDIEDSRFIENFGVSSKSSITPTLRPLREVRELPLERQVARIIPDNDSDERSKEIEESGGASYVASQKKKDETNYFSSGDRQNYATNLDRPHVFVRPHLVQELKAEASPADFIVHDERVSTGNFRAETGREMIFKQMEEERKYKGKSEFERDVDNVKYERHYK